METRRALLLRAELQFPRGPLRRHKLVLADLWRSIGNDAERSRRWARSAKDIFWQAAVGDCFSMRSQYARDQPKAVASGCARAGDLKTALEIFHSAPAERRATILLSLVRHVPESALKGLHGDLLFKRIRRWFRATSVLGRLDVEAALKFARSPAKHHTEALLRMSVSRLQGHPSDTGKKRHIRSLAAAVAQTRQVLGSRSREIAERLARVGRRSSDAPVANALSAMWVALEDRSRALWWLQHGLQLLPNHIQAHERAALGCAMAARALELNHSGAFSTAIAVSEAATQELAPEVARASLECIGLALLNRGDIHAAASIAASGEAPRLRQKLVLELLERRGFDSAFQEARRHSKEIQGRTFAMLYRKAPQLQARMAVLEEISRLDDRLVRLHAYTEIGRDARASHRHEEALRMLALAASTARGRGIARQWNGAGVAAAKREFLVQRALAEPAKGIPELLSVASSPLYLPPEARFEALTQMARDLRWLSGVDLEALTRALR